MRKRKAKISARKRLGNARSKQRTGLTEIHLDPDRPPLPSDALATALGWQDPLVLETHVRLFCGGLRTFSDRKASDAELDEMRRRLTEILDFLRTVARASRRVPAEIMRGEVSADSVAGLAALEKWKTERRTIQVNQPQTFTIDDRGRFERSRAGASHVNYLWQEIVRKLELMPDVGRLRECEKCRRLFIALQERSRFCARRCANVWHQARHYKLTTEQKENRRDG